MDPNNLVNQRFRKVYKALEKKGAIKKHSSGNSKQNFAQRVFDTDNTQIVDRYLDESGNSNVTFNHIENLYEHYQVSRVYMSLGIGPMFIKEGLTDKRILEAVAQLQLGKPNVKHLPEVAVLASEGFADSKREDFEAGEIPGLKGEFISFRVEGNSMSPTFEEGDLCLCQEFDGQPARNVVYVVVTKDSTVIKRVQVISNDKGARQYCLISDNYLEHPPFMVDEDNVLRLLKVVYRVGRVLG
jgi:hypothetical protein